MTLGPGGEWTHSSPDGTMVMDIESEGELERTYSQRMTNIPPQQYQQEINRLASDQNDPVLEEIVDSYMEDIEMLKNSPSVNPVIAMIQNSPALNPSNQDAQMVGRILTLATNLPGGDATNAIDTDTADTGFNIDLGIGTSINNPLPVPSIAAFDEDSAKSKILLSKIHNAMAKQTIKIIQDGPYYKIMNQNNEILEGYQMII